MVKLYKPTDMSLLSFIQQSRAEKRKLLAVLLDPEKVKPETLPLLADVADLLFLGSSTGNGTGELVRTLRGITSKPLVLFPGQIDQFTDEADALLFLSVLSSRNPEMLIGRQTAVARRVKESGIESIPMGYILIDGGTESSVAKASCSTPIAATDTEAVVDTSIAAQLLGKQLVYLEAGSGAKRPVSTSIIASVRSRIDIPLIVGGGIRTSEMMYAAFAAGADIVVIGNHFEQHPETASQFRIQNKI